MGLPELDNLREDIRHLSPQLQMAYIEDAILDLILANVDVDNITSATDASAVVKSFLKERVFNWTAALELSSITTHISNKLIVHLNGKSATGIDRLAKALVELSTNKESQLPIVVLAHVESERVITVRVPMINTDNHGQMDNLGFFLKFGQKILGIKASNIRVVPDKDVGEEVLLPTNLNKTLTNVMGSVETSKGLYAGEVQKYPTGFEGNLVELLGAIKILKENITSVRKKPGRKDKAGKMHKSPVVTLNDLQERVNVLLNLKQEGMAPWIVHYLKAVLGECTKYTSTFFPGCFKHAVKERNKVSTNEGILAKLGYVSVVPPTQKLRATILSRVKVTSVEKDGKKSNRYSILEWSEKENSEFTQTDFTEFRAGVCTLLPKIEPLKGNFKEQISKDVISEKREKVVATYNKEATIVDELNTAYAIKSALDSKKKGVKSEHFLQARSRFINSTANKPFVDATGREYKLYRDIPENVREYLQKFLHRKISAEKRKPDNEDQGLPDIPDRPISPLDVSVPDGPPAGNTRKKMKR
jgi:hypothetical protein